MLGVALLLISLVAAAWTFQRMPVRSTLRHLSGVVGESDGAEAIASPTSSAASSERDPAPAPTTAPTPVTPDYASLTLTAKSIYVFNADTGDVLFQRDADAPRAPASTAKIITALTVLNDVRPEEVVTIDPSDVVDPVEESNMGLQAGDTVTVHDLLVGLFLPSGNDAANALARFAGERLASSGGSSVERFVAQMNATATTLGMSESHFVNPSGDDAEGQVVSAHDLAIAARALLADPELRPIVAIPSADVRVGGPHARVIALTNTNELVLTSGIYGVKTGTTTDAGECLIVAYRSPSENVVAVILDSQDRYADASQLLGIKLSTAKSQSSD